MYSKLISSALLLVTLANIARLPDVPSLPTVYAFLDINLLLTHSTDTTGGRDEFCCFTLGSSPMVLISGNHKPHSSHIEEISIEVPALPSGRVKPGAARPIATCSLWDAERTNSNNATVGKHW
ncbi:hypothetical protein FB45DRAFT_872339 [Roridomyces roridus]|uniref:Uncharacterized protein n=1 Tax=Roridomyces roridus TaxID=1738132 RepID=A0AAD7FDR2_9AGAR|nr:hypothetical protein FB45DRAFT_872339 [Roridomyces roridus]